MSWYEWRPYVPVAERHRQAQKELKKLKRKGQSIAPVTIQGRTITKTFWGNAWCSNLERYSDLANRLPRGRTYVRNGSVVDLQVSKGEVVAFVSGSELYEVRIDIAPVARRHWKSICRDCSGAIDSLVELLQGRVAKGVMDRVCRERDGLFPSPDDIRLSCSCRDWADMCKHVAAVLYGVGARLDEQPRLLFVLRGVDENDLLASAGQNLSLTKTAPVPAQVLDESDIGSLFGLEMAEPGSAATPASTVGRQRGKNSERGVKLAILAQPAKVSNAPQVTRAKPGREQQPSPGAGKRRARRQAQRG